MGKVEYEATKLTYTITKTYIPDFIVTTKKGTCIYIETKGWLKIEDRIKMRAVKECNPDLDIRFLFDKNNKVSSRGKMKYGEWCDKYGFKYAIKEVPKEWFQE